MKINNNMSAKITNKQLLRIENSMTSTMERLSSGLKLNHAKDNPAGMAISNKMRAQIDGLDRASANASDGISVLNIADGALNETSSILQRMRELSVQAANDTNSLAEREAIQKEIEALKEEVNRISTDTEYNAMPLLDGSMNTRVYADNVTRIQTSNFVEKGNYVVEITSAAEQANLTMASSIDFTSTTAAGVEGTLSINGSKVEISATDTGVEIFEKIRENAELGETEVDLSGTNTIEMVSDRYGLGGEISITSDSAALLGALGLNGTYDADLKEYVVPKETGVDAVIDLKRGDYTLADGTEVESRFGNTATVALEGNKVIITDRDGFSMSFLANADYTGEVNFDVTDIGTMTLHIGANEDQNIEVRIPEISSESLYIDDIDVRTVTGADRAMATLDKAIAQLSEARSQIGAYTNRLEYSVSSLDAFEENMTSALSRLADADMAQEMTNYTQESVLNQAAISVLTQANEMPQQVLQLLQ